MKLYATVTSERATKGQGGEWLAIGIQNEDKETFAYINVPTLKPWDTHQKILVSYSGDYAVVELTDMHDTSNWKMSRNLKAKKEKAD